ncbi:MAG: hypothetical protein Q8N98_04990 [bacterium]|nr:hypothetical protein [bacterium]
MKEILNIYRDIFVGYWWIIAPIALFLFLNKFWLSYMTKKYLMGLKWILLEIRFPKEVAKTPKAMEQFFAGVHAAQIKLKKKDRYLKGMLAPWFSIEILGHGGEIHFYIRTEEKYRNLVESHLYAQYPHVEIFEAEDYVGFIPAGIPTKDFDAWGTELILNKPDAYPIRTYPIFFEDKEAEERTDPIAGLFEFLSSLNPNESIGIHILISPTDDKWKEDGEKLVGKLIGREVKADKKKGLMIVEEGNNWISAFANGIAEFFSFGGSDKKEEKKVDSITPYLSPGQKEIVLAIEKNIAKIGFKTMIRFLYWAPKDIFDKDKPTVAAGFFRQFNTQNLNGFTINKKSTPGRGKIFKRRREPGQKRFFVGIFKKRFFPGHKIKTRGFIFNIEELATIFHVPGTFVEAEKLSKIGAKKGSPPSELPIL